MKIIINMKRKDRKAIITRLSHGYTVSIKTLSTGNWVHYVGAIPTLQEALELVW